MKQENILLSDKLNDIKLSFVKDGWITIYYSEDIDDTQTLIYCCLVDSKRIKTYRLERDWIIRPGQEGKPVVWAKYKNGKEINIYDTYSDKGIEPFIFSKRFNYDGGHEHYIDIAEEFVLYFKLYERGAAKQDRSFYYIDESGELDEVIVIKGLSVKLKLKYLMEYLSIRKCHLAVCFDFMRFSKLSISELKIEAKHEDVSTANSIYNHYIEPCIFNNEYKTQSCIHGKVIVSPPISSKSLHFQGEYKYEEYITGYDDLGNEILQDCSNEPGKYFVMTYFKKEVLNKYYNDPVKYTVTAMNLKNNFFSLKMDNNHEEYVAVFLIELRMLPHKEQLHWKQYNIAPQKGMSSSYFKTMIEGNWAQHPETPDLYFKYKFDDFNTKWENKFGWKFYKPLAESDSYRFTSLHIPTTNNIKAFCEQMLSLVIITIDSINEQELAKDIVLDENDKGISKFDKFLKHHNKSMPEMIEFLKNLQNLRSGLVAHRFSASNKKLGSAIQYFDLKNDNYIGVAKQIFIKSVNTLNSLEKYFLNKLKK